MQLDKGKVIGGKPVVARCNATTLFDPVEEPLDPVRVAVEMRAVADWVAAVLFGGDVGPTCIFMASSLIQSAS